MAEVCYIGGHEGPTEYWWMRISPEGRRTQVTEPVAIPYAADNTGAVGGGGKSSSGASSSGAAPQAEMIAPAVLVPAPPTNAATHTVDTSALVSAVSPDSVETVGDVLASLVERLSSSEGSRSNDATSSESTAPTAAAPTVCDDQGAVEVGPEPPTDPRYYKLTEGKL